jgi:hypothetical protein
MESDPSSLALLRMTPERSLLQDDARD